MTNSVITKNIFRNIHLNNSGTVGLLTENGTEECTFEDIHSSTPDVAISHQGYNDVISKIFTQSPIMLNGNSITARDIIFHDLISPSTSTPASGLITLLGNDITIENASLNSSTNPYSYGVYMAFYLSQSAKLINVNLPNIAQSTAFTSKFDNIEIIGGNIKIHPSTLPYIKNYKVNSPVYSKHGITTITGDGSTTTFTSNVPHGLPIDDITHIAVTITSSIPSEHTYTLVDTDGDGFKETLQITSNFSSAPPSGLTIYISWNAQLV